MSQHNFEKVVGMIDAMVAELKQEQQDDADKLEYCKSQFDLADDKKKALERSVEDLEKAKAKETIATLSDEIAALTKGIVDLDKSVAEATENRKQENEDYKALMAADTAAKDLLVFAKNRLNKFYNPDLYVAPPKRELSAGDRIYENFGGELTTAAPGGIANTGIAVMAQVGSHDQGLVAPPPPPATWGAYSKKTEESAGVIGMIDLLIKDLDKEMTESKTEEKDAQADYETMMRESAEKRVADSKSLSDKEAAKADTEKSLSDLSIEKKDKTSELLATLKYIQSLHTECDWLLKYYDMREQARTGEIDSLTKAKAVLSGADYSLLQTNSQGFLGRR